MNGLTDIVLDKVTKIAEKRRSDITRSYNSIFKNIEKEFSEMNIPNEQLEIMALYGLADRWKVSKENMAGLIEDVKNTVKKTVEEISDSFEEDEDEEDIEEISLEEELGIDDLDLDEEIIIAKPPVSRESSAETETLKDLFSTAIKKGKIRDEENKSTPSLIQLYNAVYTMELLDPDAIPYEHYNEQYKSTSYVFKVKLHSISPKDYYDERYSKGDLKGKKMFVKGGKYSVWLTETALTAFGKYWRDVNNGNIDTRKFKFIKKKIGKKKTTYKIT